MGLLSASLETNLAPASAGITAARILSHIRVLASDEFAGRGPGTPGEEKTVAYLLQQCRAMGLKPGNPDGTYIQKTPLWGIKSRGTLQVTGVELTAGQDYVATSSQPKAEISVRDSQLVFAGYGAVAPEYHWNDYAGVDVKGKTVMILSGDPPTEDKSLFMGEALSYYGRAGTKAEIAFAQGASAVITVFTPRGGVTTLGGVAQAVREVMILRDENSGKRPMAQATLTAAKAGELLAQNGQNLDALRAAAAKPGFRAVELPARASFEIKSEVREILSDNVIAKVAGSDSRLRNEYVVYSGHWDHLGQDGDRIFHGASDNAAGAAGVLELARGFTKLKPRRTVLFLWTTAEEKGLLGAKYYVEHPLYPLNQTVANINLDYFSNWGWGKTKDISIVGLGNSTLDDLVEAAAKRQGRVVTGDTAPAEGFYFRSDHFEFNKGGVPSLETSPGIDYVGKPETFGTEKRAEYIRNDYHKTTDVPKPDWDLNGAVEDLQVLLETGYRAAQADGRPAWKPGALWRFSH